MASFKKMKDKLGLYLLKKLYKKKLLFLGLSLQIN